MGILDWSPENRPRERLLQQGAQVLSDAELLAIFLRTGLRGKTAVDLAHDLLAQFGGISAILGADRRTFCSNPGLGPCKFATLQAILEMTKRAHLDPLKKQPVLADPEAVHRFLGSWLQHQPFEIFAILLLDSQNRLIQAQELFRGTVNQTSVYPREVVKSCMSAGAVSVIFSHNHPSGCAEPSRADLYLTQTLKSALSLVDVSVLDHVIVAGTERYSFAQHGQI